MSDLDRSKRLRDEILTAECVLCVQPHYDDNDIAAGGTFALLADAGVDVHYLTVTDNIAGVKDPDLSDADALALTRQEQEDAGRDIGVASQIRLDLPDAGDWSEIQVRTAVIEQIRRLRPDYVFTCDPWLPHEAHRDHLRVGIAVGEAVMFHGLPRFKTVPEADDGYEGHEVRGFVLYYTLEGNLTFDVTKTHDRKHAAMGRYQAQISGQNLVNLRRGIGAMEGIWGKPEGFTHGETFKLLRPGQLHVGLMPALQGA
jgi:LmbE family N-acetylglucosaminyl deacetylase